MRLRPVIMASTIILWFAMIAVAGSDNAAKIIGEWEYVKIGDKVPPPKLGTITFTKDGKVQRSLKDGDKVVVIEDGTYTVKDDKITIKKKGEDKQENATIKKLTDKELILDT